MSDRVRAIIESLSDADRQELFDSLLREHFAAGEREVRVLDDEGALIGYLTTPGIHSCYQLGIDPKEMPRELTGPYYPAGAGIKQAMQMEVEAATSATGPK